MSGRTTPPASREKLIAALKQDSFAKAIPIAYNLTVSRSRIIYFLEDCANAGLTVPAQLRSRTACEIPPGLEATEIPKGMVLTHERFHCPKCGALLSMISQTCVGCFSDITYKKINHTHIVEWVEKD